MQMLLLDPYAQVALQQVQGGTPPLHCPWTAQQQQLGP
jgi:hypothetical protein